MIENPRPCLVKHPTLLDSQILHTQPSPKPSSQLMTRKQYADPFASDEDDVANGKSESLEKKAPTTTTLKTPEEQAAEDTYEVVTKRYSITPAASVRLVD